MPATIIDGKALGAKVREEVAASVAELGQVGLATILVGDDPASHIYIDLKQKAATQAGMNARDLKLPADTSEEILDTTLGDQVVHLIRDEMKSRGTAAIIVTHDDRITHYADRTVHIVDGRIDA